MLTIDDIGGAMGYRTLRSLIMGRLIVVAVLGAGALSLNACQKQDDARDPDALFMQNGYVQAPKIVSVTRLGNGVFHITGRAGPEGRVRLTSDRNRSVGLTADNKGVFQIDLAPDATGSLYELAMEDEGRLMSSESRLFIPPQGPPAGLYEGPRQAVLVRTGAPSVPIMSDAPLIAVVDYDNAGLAAVSGRATPGAVVELSIPGRGSVKAHANAHGLYNAVLSIEGAGAQTPLTLQANSGALHEDRRLTPQSADAAGAVAALNDAQPVSVIPENGGWRVMWLLPGGGAQVSMVY